jgi:hypothetical protein
MISYAHEDGLNKVQLQSWYVRLQERYNLKPDIGIRGIVTEALAIDGMRMALDVNRPSLVEKTRLIELIKSRHWDHQVVLDILDSVCTLTNHFLDFFCSCSIYSF